MNRKIIKRIMMAAMATGVAISSVLGLGPIDGKMSARAAENYIYCNSYEELRNAMIQKVMARESSSFLDTNRVYMSEALYSSLVGEPGVFADIYGSATSQMELPEYMGDYASIEGHTSTYTFDFQDYLDLRYSENEREYFKLENDGKTYYGAELYMAAFLTSKEQEEKFTKDIHELCKNGELAYLKNESNYTKIRAIQDYVVDHVRYSTKGNTDRYYLSALSAFYEGEADCRGYALLFYRLLREFDIPVRIVETGMHIWNLVWLDGAWYSCDASDGKDTFLMGTIRRPIDEVCMPATMTVTYLDEPEIDEYGNMTYVKTDFEAVPGYRENIVCKVSPNDYVLGGKNRNYGLVPGMVKLPEGDYSGVHCKWVEANVAKVWFENGKIQGTLGDPNGVMGDGTVRGREIYDSESDGWYWLDSIYDGAKAVNKEVWMPYIYQDEATWDDEKIAFNAKNSFDMAEQVTKAINDRSGKWVRYDANGKMVKGWYTVEGDDLELYPNQAGNTYYYDYQTGLMAKGWVTIDGERYHFDEVTGALK